jgi:hypothetical protein
MDCAGAWAMKLSLMLLPPIVAAAITTLLVSMVQYYAPDIEGKIFPVSTSDPHSITVDLKSVQEITVSGIASKFRDCEFTGTEIFVTGDGANRELARLTVGRSIKLRPVSVGFPWGPWQITVPVYRSNLQIKAITTHRCHPLWPTRTVFWDVTLNNLGAIE